MAEEKGPGRGKGKWTAKGAQAAQDERITALEEQVELLSAAVFAPEEPPEEPPAV